ncbi:MAG: Flp pilus assembly protein CpaB [Chloroflexota bacterium]|nr:Flp pilus assembly protein CpaB [Chloroflexota bacterium]
MARVATGSAGSRTNRKFLIVAVLFGALTAVLFYAVTSRGGTSSTTTTGGDVQVVVAKAAIPQRTTITASMLELKNVPLSATVAGYFAETTALVGKVTRFPVAANQQLAADAIIDTSPGATVGLSGVVPVGQRAISIQASQIISAGGLILPGDFVDLVWSWPKQEPLTSKTVLRNVQVAAVAQSIVNSSPAAAAGSAPSSAAASDAKTTDGKSIADAVTLTLLLSEQDSQKIFLAEQTGTIRATLRNKGDQDLADTGVADINQLVPIDVVKSLPPELRPRSFGGAGGSAAVAAPN